uniref:2,4-dienoyl-CoA reductase ((2E)-enoyl-CoA-producing) n=1 Tax=Macrostomum lignano TaxID=282301 RepID=A0A1I8FHS5_9PLAT
VPPGLTMLRDLLPPGTADSDPQIGLTEVTEALLSGDSNVAIATALRLTRCSAEQSQAAGWIAALRTLATMKFEHGSKPVSSLKSLGSVALFDRCLRQLDRIKVPAVSAESALISHDPLSSPSAPTVARAPSCRRRLSSSPSEPRSRHFPPVTGPNPMLPAGCLDGRVALVTGGGTGLGKGLATALSRLGASVAISGRKPGPLDSAAKEINQATGKPVAALPCDDPRRRQRCRSRPGQLRETTGRAAKSGCEQCRRAIFPTERLSANAFRTVVDIVLLGTANVTMATAKRLIKAQQGGSFLSVTTVYAETGSPLAKEAMTKSLAAEWGRYGLRFNCIAPGPIQTKGAFSRLDPTGEFIAHAVKRIPAVYLLSDYASWINGSVIRFDGGEICSVSGEFSPLLRITGEQWDAMEKMIRSVKGS